MSGVDSSVILVNLTNDTKIANKAIVTGISSSGTQSPSQGNVHHMIMPASNGNWYTSTVSSASSGHYNIDIDDDVIEKIICFGDCLSLCLLDSSDIYEEKINNFVSDIIKLDYEYDIDRYWLLFYQRFFKDKAPSPYNDKCFDIMKGYGVDFMPDENYKTKAESYCHVVNNPFLEDGDEIVSFNDYMAIA